MFSQGFIVGNVEVMEFRAAVVAGESGQLLKMLRLEFDDGHGAIAVRLLTAGHERLAEETADGFASVEAQVAGTRGEAEDFLGPGCAEPLEINGQLRRVEIFANERGRKS